MKKTNKNVLRQELEEKEKIKDVVTSKVVPLPPTLFPVVVQDALTRDVLMLAYADAEALRRTRRTKMAWFYSRSRNAYWKKGATSGNTMRVTAVRWDCDKDALLYEVTPKGPACHTGADTCFGPRKFSLEFLGQSLDLPKRRKNSYTEKLLDEPWLLAEKLSEEGAELGETTSKRQTVWESADVLYFTMVKLVQQGVRLQDVLRKLERRNKKR